MSNAEEGRQSNVDQIVADNVRAELARERWTGRKAAVALGLTPTYVSRRLAGTTVLSPGDLKMFAELLGVPVARFFDETGKGPTRGGVGPLLPDLDSNQEPAG